MKQFLNGEVIVKYELAVRESGVWRTQSPEVGDLFIFPENSEQPETVEGKLKGLLFRSC